MRLLSRHVDGIASDNIITKTDVIRFTETQIRLSDSTCKIIGTLNFFNKIENNLLRLACGCRNNVAVLRIFDANEVSVLSFKKYAFADEAFTLKLDHRKQ